MIAQFGINIAGNAVSGGIDLASLFPKYLNIRRGEYITTLMALPMCPWALVSGATVYISVMSGYATFLGPMTGLMVFDYIFVRKHKMKLSALVSPCAFSSQGSRMTSGCLSMLVFADPDLSTTLLPTRSTGTGMVSTGAPPLLGYAVSPRSSQASSSPWTRVSSLPSVRHTSTTSASPVSVP